MTTDNLQNIYAVTTKNEVIKYHPDGRVAFRYQNSTLGGELFLDASDPFQLLLFYPEHQTLLLLDRTLSLSTQINLFQHGFLQVAAAGKASDGGIWLYDEANFRLKKINTAGEVTAESADLSLTLQRAIQPNYLVENEQQVFLNDPQVGILLFDIFGNYLKTLDIKGLRRFYATSDYILFFENGQWQYFHITALVQGRLGLSPDIPVVENLYQGKGRYYILREDGILVLEKK